MLVQNFLVIIYNPFSFLLTVISLIFSLALYLFIIIIIAADFEVSTYKQIKRNEIYFANNFL